MITIYDKTGHAIDTTEVLKQLPITRDCQHVEEMMKDDYVALSWNDTMRYSLPVGAYITPFPDERNPYDYNDTRYPVKYRLLEEYDPEGRNESSFSYEPHFKHPIMWLSRLPFILATGNISTWSEALKKTSWGYTGNASHIASYIVECINWYAAHNALFNSTIGGTWYALVDTDLPASATVNFEGVDVMSAASLMAQAFDCEFHFDYAQRCFHLGKIQYGTNVVLKSGQNVGVANVTRPRSDFHNAFLIKGSTRNLSQPTDTGENAQVRERLTLNPVDYPDGVMYTNDSGEVITKSQFDALGVPLLMEELVFDGIYPKLELYLYNVRERECWLLDEFGEKVPDSQNPRGYKTYSKWYTRLAYPVYNTDGTVQTWHDYLIGDGSIIDGQTLQITFLPNTKEGAETSLMIGQGDFDLVYFDEQTVEKEDDDISPDGFTAYAGDYRIVFKDGTPIIPTTSDGGIYPQGELSPSLDGNMATLINVVVDEDYKTIAQTELEKTAIRKVQQERMNLNNYTVKTNPVYFEENEVWLHIGQSVTYNDGGDLNGGTSQTLDTHIIKIVSQLDLPFVKEITVGNEKIQGNINSIKDDVANIVANIGSGTDLSDQQLQRIMKNYGSKMFLSKKNDDTAQGFIRFIKGLQVGERFVPGLLGEGGVFRKEADGTTYIEADNLYIRMKAYFDTVEIRKFLHTGGNRIATVAGAKCVRVEWRDSSNNVLTQEQSNLSRAVKFRCFFRANDGDNIVTNDFLVGDQAYCHVTRMQSETMEQASEGTGGSMLTTRHYWRLVIGTNVSDDGGRLTEDGEYWIDLSNRASETLTIGGTQYTHDGYQSGSDIPNAQDDIVQLGNIEDTTRQGAIIEFVTGGDSPSYQIFQGIDEFSFVGKNYISLGYATGSTNTHGAGHAYMDLYGDVFIGAKPDAVTGESPTYIKYDSADKKLTIKAIIDGSSPIGDTDTTIEQALADLLDDITDLQSQIDGSIETFFNDYMPVAKTQEGAPANRVPLVTITIDGHTVPCEPYYSWYTADHGGTASEVNTERLKHLGDIFYDNTSGYAFRFSLNESTHVFEWVEITDSAVIKALRDAAEAYGLADTKNKIFTTVAGQLPPYPWKEGDLWVNATYPADGSIYSNDILKCKQDKTSDGSINDWTLASKYTDDKKVERYTNILTGSVQPSESSEKEIALAAENAIRTALGGNFILDGGLMLMSIIGMRKLNEGGDPSDPDDYTTWAGISGVYDDNLYGGGVAAWYGGGLVDKRNPTTGEYDVANGAKSGFRFDGSGWLADGNINWNAQGAMVIKNIETIYGTGNDSISINELSALTSIFHTETYGSGNITELLVKPQNAYSQLFINRSGNPLPASLYPQDHTINEYSVLNYGEMKARFVPLEFFNALFTAYSDANHTNAINPWTWTDTAAASRAAINNLKILVGTWTEQYLSALGHNSQQGGGGGIGDVTWEALAGAGNQQINISHLSSAGVATQSWVRSQFGSSVVRVDVGTDQYFPTGGIVSLPAYPTTLPASDVSEWAKADTKPTYAYSEISDRPTSWWGVSSIDANGAVKGSMSNVGDIAFSASGKNIGGLLYFIISQTTPQIKVGSDATLVQYAYSNGTFTPKLYVDGYAGVNGEIFAKGLELVGSDSAGNEHGGYIDFHYSKSASDYTSRIIEKESGLIQLSTKIQTSRIYLYKPNANDTDAVYLECDTDHNVKLVGNFYATGAVSALGSNSQQGGAGVTLNQPLSAINSAGLSAPTVNGSVLVYSNNVWKYSSNAGIFATAINIAGTASAAGFSATGRDNTYVLLGGGSTSKLKTINGNSIFGDGDIVVSGGGDSSSYVKYAGNQTSIGQSSPFSGATAWATDENIPNGNALVYNNSGSEFSMLYSFYPVDIRYGTILRWGYADKYIRIARKQTGNWLSEDWEKISAGYSDTTGKLNTQVSIWGQQFDGSGDIGIDRNAKMPLVYFKKYDDDGNAGYVGRGSDSHNGILLGSYVSDLHLFANNGNFDLYINTSHNVGIGTNAPDSKLHVNGRIKGTGGLLVSGRVQNSGDDEGVVIGMTSRWAGLCLGSPTGPRAVLYLTCNTDQTEYNTYWRFFQSGSSTYDIYHPKKSGTIALTSDIPSSLPASDVYAWAKASTKPSYNLDEVSDGSTRKLSNYVLLAGDTMTGKLTVKAPIFGYNYSTGGGNAAAFVFDKSGSNYTGIGAHSTPDVIWFGACNADGAWVDTYKQIWDFNGTIKQEGNAVIHAGNIASQTVSSCTGNAGSATKLQTSHTIWGASFDGTGDITGNLMGAGGYIDFQYNDEINRYGGTLYLQHRGGQTTTGQGTGGTTTGSLVMCCNGGNVGIGMYSNLTDRLNVKGTIGVTGVSDGGFRITSSGADENYMFGASTTGYIWGSVNGRYLSFSGGIVQVHKSYFANNVAHYFREPTADGWRGGMYWGTAGNEALCFIAKNANTKFMFVNNSDIADWANNTHQSVTPLMSIGTNVGIGTQSPSQKLHVVGRVVSERSDISGFDVIRGDYKVRFDVNGSNYGYLSVAKTDGSASAVRISMSPIDSTNPYVFISPNLKVASNDSTTDGSYVQIGGVFLIYDANSNAIKVAANKEGTSAANFYATGAVSALGANTSSGGGSGNYVTLDGSQTITGAKTFNATVQITQKLTVSNSIDVSGVIRSTNSSISCAHDITAGGNLSINGTATIGGHMTIGATVAVGTVNSQVIQTLNSRAIYIKTGTAPNFVDGTWSNTSDMRLKDIINNVGASVDQIANAPIFNYKWKSGGVSIMLGSSAQYWQNVFQHAVEIGPENYLYMDYSSVALASAVMVARKVQNHEDRILKLERENEQLRNEIKQLKAA